MICGLRRSGKSVILKQIIEGLKLSDIDDSHIIYINFESLDYADIKNAKELDTYIKSFVKDSKIYYVFLMKFKK